MRQSRLERFYAYVQTKDGDLGEQLVRNGLARIYGFKAAPPGLRNLRVEMEKLQQLENAAKQEKIGAWCVSIGRLNATRANSGPSSNFATYQKPRGPGPAPASTSFL